MIKTTVRRLQYLDALRGIAVLMVILVHSTELTDITKFPVMFRNLVASGIYGVQLFFVISAFTLFYTLNFEKKTAADFYLRRFFRIAPAYYLAIICYSIYNNNWRIDTFLNFAFLHGFSPNAINSVVPGGWSIGIEMFFYLIVPFLFRYIDTTTKAIYFLIFSLAFKTICFYLLKLSLFSALAAKGSFIYFWFPNQLPVFAVGFVLYFYITTKQTKPEPLHHNGLLILLILGIFSVMTQLPVFGNHITIAMLFAGCIAILAKVATPWLENKIFLFIGKISYSAYLCQYGMVFLLKRLDILNIFPTNNAIGSYANFSYNLLLLVAFTMCCAYLIYLVVEQPFQKLGKIVIKKYLGPQSTSQVKTV